MYFWQFLKTELNEMSKYVISRLQDLKCRTLQRLKSGICRDRIWNPAELVFGFWNLLDSFMWGNYVGHLKI